MTFGTTLVVARTPRSTERKAEDVLGGQFGFRRGEGTRDATGMQKMISEGKFRHRRGTVCVLHRLTEGI